MILSSPGRKALFGSSSSLVSSSSISWGSKRSSSLSSAERSSTSLASMIARASDTVTTRENMVFNF